MKKHPETPEARADRHLRYRILAAALFAVTLMVLLRYFVFPIPTTVTA